MLIRRVGSRDLLEVYGFYSVNGERIFFIVPSLGYPGFVAISENDSELVDSSLDEKFVLRKNDAGEDLYLHWAADEHDLIYDLIENEPGAIERFFHLKKSKME